MKNLKKFGGQSATALSIAVCALTSSLSHSAVLEEVVVTAQKRAQNIQDVPISISAMTGDELSSKLAGGETILALASSTPGLYAETSGGRSAPRFYMRGLGNADFNQAASQPVSIVMDEVPMEKSAFKSFPLFDVQNVEVIRGPQGTLFGRNTTAGIIKLESRRPSDELSGYVTLSAGNLGNRNLEGGVGGPLVDDVLSGRISLKTQHRDDWIDNGFTGENDALGGYTDTAGRVQLLWTPNDNFTAWFMHQRRDESGNTASMFRANILSKGSNNLNSNFDRDKVFFDGGDNNVAFIEAEGTTVKLDWDVGDYTVTSITSYQEAERGSRGDIDGGFGCGFCGQDTGPGFIPFAVDTASDSDLEQFTQEIRIASNFDGPFNYQVGGFYFTDELDSDALDIRDAVAPSDIGVRSNAVIENTTWAVFGQGSYDFNDQTTLTAGIRYTDDEKDATYTIPETSTIFGTTNPPPQKLADDKVSWDLALAHAIDDDTRLFARIASSFRGSTIQTRISDDPGITSADAEDIISYEVGIKVDLWEKLRVNAAVFHYVIDDIQLTAVGGADNSVRLLNAEEGTGTGIEFDFEYLVSEHLVLSGGFGYNDTSINEPGLATAVCGFGNCTVTDPLTPEGLALIDGNPFQHSPEWTLNFELDYSRPISDDAEIFFYTDWKVKGPTNDFLYESIEYDFDSQFEGGLRVGYRNVTNDYEVVLFGRNITDEENVIGGIDFNNLTAYVNGPRVIGIEASYNF